MAGYYGYSMSNNAVDAYDSGERPMSKWTKASLLERYEELCEEYDIKFYDLSKVNAKTLKFRLLHKTSWHHTSSMFNCTDFYDVSLSECENLTEDRVQLMRDVKPTKTNKIKEESCIEKWEVEYLTWSGTRKYPTATEHREIVEYDTSKGYVNTINGRKMISANGFRFIKKEEGK